MCMYHAMYVEMSPHIFICIAVYTSTCVWRALVYVYTSMYSAIPLHIYIYIERKIERDREMNINTGSLPCALQVTRAATGCMLHAAGSMHMAAIYVCAIRDL